MNAKNSQLSITSSQLASMFDSAADLGASSSGAFAAAGQLLADNFNLKGGRQLAREAVRASLVHAASRRALYLQWAAGEQGEGQGEGGQEEDETSPIDRIAYVARLVHHTGDLTCEMVSASVMTFCKNSKDSLVQGYRRALKSIGFGLTIGKGRDPMTQSVEFNKLAAKKPNPANGKETSKVVTPTSGEPDSHSHKPESITAVSPTAQAHMIIKAFDALDADLQDKVAAHVLATLESRKGADGKTKGGQLAAAYRTAQASNLTH